MRTGRLAAYGAGLTLVAYGVGGLVTHATDTNPVGWAAWFIGVAMVHDFVLVPLTLAAALAVARIPGPYQGPLRGALIISAAVTLVSLPLVLGLGRRADNPSVLPLPYATDLLIIVTVILLAGLAVGWRKARHGPGSHRPSASDRARRSRRAHRRSHLSEHP
jgi:hypothetical protein